MIYEIQGELKGCGVRRLVAVVADKEDKAKEIADRFAIYGDVVDARWYTSARGLLETEGGPKFEAVILFEGRDKTAADTLEAEVRVALRETPVYRL